MAIVRRAALHAHLDVPTDRLASAIGAMREPALLEGGPRLGSDGRWSILAAEPRLVFSADADSWTEQRDGRAMRRGRTDPLLELKRILREFQLAEVDDRADPEGPPFQGGLIGFFSYDLAPRLERLARQAPADSRIPVLRFGLYDWAVIVDHASGCVTASVFDLMDEGEPALISRMKRVSDIVRRAESPKARTALTSAIGSNFTRAEYVRTVERVLEYIAAGDVFQINLSQRFTARGRIEPLDLYLRLKQHSPAPLSAFLRWDDQAVVCASPESFYQTRGDRIVTRPIKGTRPRGRTPEEDARLAAELQHSAKDRAELTMIVDLERNDLGRVCRYGTIRVAEALAIETFAQVHHLVATVQGRLRPDAGAIDVVRAVFPGGSITGAPKIRAMELIDEIEPTRRSLYTGAIGYFSRGGSSALNIAIRTMLVEGDRVSFQVGGGVVADSDPEAEYEETLHKGRGILSVLEGKEARS